LMTARATRKGPTTGGEESLGADVTAAYGALFFTLVAGNAPGLPGNILSPMPYFAALATCSIVIGSKRGLRNTEVEMISLKQGATAPIFLSFSLVGLYTLQRLDISLESFINGYFTILESVAGVTSLWPLHQAAAAKSGVLGKPVGTIDLSWISLESGETLPKEYGVKAGSVLLVLGCVALAVADRYGGENFTLNNLEACFIVTTWLELLGVNSFKTAVILLFGLLFYDVTWVFGSPKILELASRLLGGAGDFMPKNGSVMADVAMSPMLSTPTKFLFPRASALASSSSSSGFDFSLLGLGDVLVPGLLIGLLLRFDEQGSKEQNYFSSALAAYCIGLLVSFAASLVSSQGQPALLYLVPLTVGTAVFTAFKGSEFGDLWDYKASSKK